MKQNTIKKNERKVYLWDLKRGWDVKQVQEKLLIKENFQSDLFHVCRYDYKLRIKTK